jgi:hypothetical protein
LPPDAALDNKSLSRGLGDEKLQTPHSLGKAAAYPVAFLFLHHRKDQQMNPETGNPFAVLSAINVNDSLERKDGLSYLPWACAVDHLLQKYPDASWDFRWFGDKPYLKDAYGVMVFCTVTIGQVSRTAFLPVMDQSNQAIKEPDMRDINDTMQRCLTKAISLQGLALYVYRGDGVPGSNAPQSETPAPKASVSQLPDSRPASASQLRYIKRLIEETGHDLQALLDFFSVSALEELTSRAASRAIKSLQKNRRAA